MEYVLMIGAIVCVYIITIIFGKADEAKRKKRFIKRLKEEYHKPQAGEFSEAREKSENGYFLQHCDEQFCLDDITWNDLEMERVYRMINHCYSSAGDEYLYYRLRVPKLNEDENERDREERIIEYMNENEDQRIKAQLVFAKMGRTGKFSIFSYLEYLNQIKRVNPYLYLLIWLVYFLLIGMVFINAPVGIIGIAVFSVWNILSYMKKRKEIEPYLISFKYILRIMKAAEELSKCAPDIWNEEKKELLKLRKSLRIVSGAGVWFVDDSGSLSTGGDLSLMLLNYVKMISHLDLFFFYRMLQRVESSKNEINQMITIMGRMETQISIGAFRNSLHEYCTPDFSNQGNMCIEEAFHPLLQDPVANSFSISKGMLITGSNASGKSTFLKTVAVNAVLAQSIQTVAAKKYSAEYYRIYSSMALRDNMQGGESYYMVEIRSLKRIMDAATEQGVKVLCFVDEVLRGTNTVERIAASTQIMKGLAGNNSLCFAATHDIELTGLLEKQFENYHFEEEISGDDIIFCYQLLSGKARTRNAIRLLSMLGYPKRVIDNANEMAQHFIETNKWVNMEE